MNPMMVRFLLTTAATVGMKIYAQRQARKSESNDAIAQYMVCMINDGKVEMDEFDKIALAELGITVEQEEEA